MGDDGQQQDDEFERRLFQVLALLERAGEQQRAAAATLERLAGLEPRINHVIEVTGAEAAARIAEESRSALEGAVTEAATTMRQAARSAVAAAENLRLPWWLNLAAILLTGVLSASLAFWATHRVDLADYQQDQRSLQLIREGQMLERVWPRLSPAQHKKLEQLNTGQ
jgi:hypothetical protein